MDVPAPAAGVVKELKLKLGDKVSEGRRSSTLETATAGRRRRRARRAPRAAAPPPPAAAAPAPSAPAAAVCAARLRAATAPSRLTTAITLPRAIDDESIQGRSRVRHRCASSRASSVVDLAQGQGHRPERPHPAGRRPELDQAGHERRCNRGAQGGGISGGGQLNLLPWPAVDFTKFGAIEAKPLSRIKKISGANLARNWVMIPTSRSSTRPTSPTSRRSASQLNKENEKAGIKITMLAFAIRASVAALRSSRLQRFAGWRQPRSSSRLFPHRIRRGHAQRTRRAGHQERRPERRAADREGDGRAVGEGARRQARVRPTCRAAAFRSRRWAASAAPPSRRSSTRRKSPSSAFRKSATKPVWNGKDVRASPHGAAVASYDHRVIDGRRRRASPRISRACSPTCGAWCRERRRAVPARTAVPRGAAKRPN